MIAAAAVLDEPAPAEAKVPRDLAAQVAHYGQTAKRSRQVLRFFDSHRWLLRDPRFADEAQRQRDRHSRMLATATRRLAAAKSEIARRAHAAAALKARRLAAHEARAAARAKALKPHAAICEVFGDDCAAALRVARCESRLLTVAQNGQYLGLFQMGSSERGLYGHGPSAFEQAKAAHRYFVASGRDWSPWSCKP